MTKPMKTMFSTCLPVKAILILGFLFLISGNVFSQGDDCSNATLLTPATSCSISAGNLKSKAPTAGVPGTCGNATSADGWYYFVATSSFPTITVNVLGANFQAATPVMQLLTGTCAGLTSVACVTGTTTGTTLVLNTLTAVGGSGLTIGATYYVRIYTNTATGTISTNGWTFTLCVTQSAGPATVDYGKSYINVTKGTTGGTVEPGDTLEVRATFVVKANTAYHCTYTDNVPTGSTYIPGTLRVLTNEGKIYQQFGDGTADGDGGSIAGTAITINMGTGANATTGGTVSNTSRPNFYGSTCIMVVSFRIVVTGAYNTQVNVGNGAFNYNKGTGAVSINFPAYNIMVFKNYGVCSNTVGTNALINEYGGTFGTGGGTGAAKDRVASNKVPSNYTYAAFSSGGAMPQDYYYGISNNTSGGTTAATGYATSNTAWAIPDGSSPSHRIFGVWDIIGDHTGATNPLLGNAPTDDVGGATGGYMVVVNAAYRTDTAFLDTVYNLCPNTYYQYTAWFRNICSRCGCDSTGKGAGTSGYIPTATGDSSGVYPNLTFNINGYDYYTTGNMLHTGQWVQKGFTYLTGPAQTTMVISIRNNAPGGGGNDWAIDDIGVASCYPNMVLTPNKPDTLCQGQDDTVRFKVNSFFNNYTEWKLEKSTDGGTTWTTTGADTTGAAASGSATPVYNSGTNQYEYLVTRYFRLNAIDGLINYRITVASTTANLSNSNCSFITTQPKIIYSINCNIALPTYLVSYKGQEKGGLAALQWISADETEGVVFIVERSDDGIHFATAGTLQGTAAAGQGAGYQFTDPKALAGQVYYRIRIASGTYQRYSNQLLLSSTGFDFAVRSLVNPFTDHITVDLTSPSDATIQVSLLDMYGRLIRQVKQPVTQGMNNFTLYGLGSLPNGTYVLKIQNGEQVISKKLIKLK